MKAKARFQLISKKILDNFFQGLLYLAPIGVTFYIIYLLFNFVDSRVQLLVEQIFSFRIPGLGIVLLFIFVSILGYFGQKIITRPVKIIFEKLLNRAPFIELVYTSIKDFLSAFVGKEKKFNQPVLVKLSKTMDLEKIGFITETDLSKLNITGKVAVYFPFSYNFNGEIYIVPNDLITPINLPPADVMKFLISGGVAKL